MAPYLCDSTTSNCASDRQLVDPSHCLGPPARRPPVRNPLLIERIDFRLETRHRRRRSRPRQQPFDQLERVLDSGGLHLDFIPRRRRLPHPSSGRTRPYPRGRRAGVVPFARDG